MTGPAGGQPAPPPGGPPAAPPLDPQIQAAILQATATSDSAQLAFRGTRLMAGVGLVGSIAALGGTVYADLHEPPPPDPPAIVQQAPLRSCDVIYREGLRFARDNKGMRVTIAKDGRAPKLPFSQADQQRCPDIEYWIENEY